MTHIFVKATCFLREIKEADIRFSIGCELLHESMRCETHIALIQKRIAILVRAAWTAVPVQIWEMPYDHIIVVTFLGFRRQEYFGDSAAFCLRRL